MKVEFWKIFQCNILLQHLKLLQHLLLQYLFLQHLYSTTSTSNTYFYHLFLLLYLYLCLLLNNLLYILLEHFGTIIIYIALFL